jgi:uncharacterized membrane protein
MEIVQCISFIIFIILAVGGLVVRVRLSRESPLKSLLFGYGLILLGFLLFISNLLFREPNLLLIECAFFIIFYLLTVAIEAFFISTIYPNAGKRYKEELDEIFKRK